VAGEHGIDPAGQPEDFSLAKLRSKYSHIFPLANFYQRNSKLTYCAGPHSVHAIHGTVFLPRDIVTQGRDDVGRPLWVPDCSSSRLKRRALTFGRIRREQHSARDQLLGICENAGQGFFVGFTFVGNGCRKGAEIWSCEPCAVQLRDAICPKNFLRSLSALPV